MRKREFLEERSQKRRVGEPKKKGIGRKEKREERKERRKKRREEERRYKEFDVDRSIKSRPIDLEF